ncbi:MAG: hypothetical protein IJD48_01540 [Clostridia bacterium]|nr:hypothetical protein [Clostridia bacterium]
MNEVYGTTTDAFYYRHESVKAAKAREDHKRAIYGSVDYSQTIIVNGMGVRPVCSSGLIIESEEKTVNVRGGEYTARDYSLNPVAMDDIVKNLSNATRDELRLVLTVAPPDVLNNPEFKQTFRDRAEETARHAEVPALQSQRLMENEEFDNFFEQIQGAVYDPINRTYYPQGYVREHDYVQPTETTTQPVSPIEAEEKQDPLSVVIKPVDPNAEEGQAQ